MKPLNLLIYGLAAPPETKLLADSWIQIWSTARQAISPYILLILLIGSGMILFALAGFGILFYYRQRSAQPAEGKHRLNISRSDGAERSSTQARQPKPIPAQANGSELELELNWKGLLWKRTGWKGSLWREPDGEVLFPPVDLVLRFRVGISPHTSPNRRPNLGMASLKADFEIDGIPPQQNLLKKAKHLRIIERSAVQVGGEMALGMLKEGRYTFYLEIPDSAGALQQIELQFSCILPQMKLFLEQDGKTAEARFRQGQRASPQAEIPFFKPRGLRFSFWIRGLPEPPGMDAWLDSAHPPELTASFPLQPHPKITIRPGANLLKGGEVQRSVVFTRWRGNQVQGTFYATGPLMDGLHWFQLVVKDDRGNEYCARLDFLVAEGALQAVSQTGERLGVITPAKWEERQVNEDTIRRHLFHLQAVDPSFKQPQTAFVESLDAEGKPIVPPFHLPMQLEAETCRLRSTMPLLAYPREKPAPVSGNILPIPITTGGILRASLPIPGIQPLELPVAHFKIDRIWGSVEDHGILEEQRFTIIIWFTLPEMELPEEIYLFLSIKDSGGNRWQTTAKPIALPAAAGESPPFHRKALAQFCILAENTPGGIFSIFPRGPFNPISLRLELALSLDPEFPLPPAEGYLPLCSLGSPWLEIGEREFNPDENDKPAMINPLADEPILPVMMSLRPRGAATRALGSIQLEVEGKVIDRHVVEFPPLQSVIGIDGVKQFERLPIEWKADLTPLCRARGAIVFYFIVQAQDDDHKSEFWYRLKRAIPSCPIVDEIERSGVEFRWHSGQGGEESRRIEGNAFLNPQHAVVLPYDAEVNIACTILAKNFYNHLAPVHAGVTVEWELEETDSGVQLWDGMRTVKTYRSLTDDSGIAGAVFRTPPAEAKKGEIVVNLRVRTEGKEWVSFPFRIRQRAILRVEGPRQVISFSQHTYEIYTNTGGEESAEWAFYPPNPDGSMPAQPAFTSRGRSLRCSFDKIPYQRGVINPPRSYRYWIAARYAGDEEIILVRALQIEVNPRIDYDIYELGSTLTMQARIYPVLPFEPFPWRWTLQYEGDDQPLELAHEESPDQLESRIKPYLYERPGKYRLRVEIGGGYRDQSFRVEPLRIFGPHVVQPGMTAQLILRNENLQRAKWSVYRGVDRIDYDTGSKLAWRSNAIGYYEITVEWSKDDDPNSVQNNAIHRILVARIYSDPAVPADTPIPPGERRRYLVSPVEFRGRKPRWRMIYQRGEKIWAENLGEAESIWVSNTGEADKGILEVNFGSYEDMTDVTINMNVLFQGDRTIGSGVRL